MESLAYEKKADDQLMTTRPLDHDDLLTSHGAVGTGWKGGNPPPQIWSNLLTLSQSEGQITPLLLAPTP